MDLPELLDDRRLHGLQRIRRTLGPARAALAIDDAGSELLDRLLETLNAFTGPDHEQEDDITLVTLPPYWPELNPVERVWLYFKERFLSLRLLNDYGAIVLAASRAWNRLLRQTGRIASLTAFPWIMRVKP